jgi:hypothetical protein
MKKPRPKPAPLPGHLAPPPADLGRSGRELWISIIREYECDDSGSQAVLAEACRAADMAASCREQIKKEGLVVQTKSGTRDHPLIKPMLMSQSFMSRTLIRLGAVDTPQPVLGRPSGRGNLGIDRTVSMRLNGRDA